MIRGVGTDIVEIERLQKIVESKSAGRFIRRVLTDRERQLAEDRKGRLAEFVAGRFAAKEAIAKAIGCGIGPKLGFHDMEIIPDIAGKPVCKLSERSRRMAGCGEAARLHLSISHSDKVAVAFAVWEDE